MIPNIYCTRISQPVLRRPYPYSPSRTSAELTSVQQQHVTRLWIGAPPRFAKVPGPASNEATIDGVLHARHLSPILMADDSFVSPVLLPNPSGLGLLRDRQWWPSSAMRRGLRCASQPARQREGQVARITSTSAAQTPAALSVARVCQPSYRENAVLVHSARAPHARGPRTSGRRLRSLQFPMRV